MNKKYSNPPIIEAFCDFRFSNNVYWDNAIPGIFYSLIKNEFPIRAQRIIKELNIEDSVSQGPVNKEILQFFSNDRKKLVQVGERFLTVNRLKPYNSWEEFFPSVESSYSCLSDVLNGDFSLDRIGLRFINSIEIPVNESYDLSKFLNFHPRIPEGIDYNFSSFITGCFFDISETDGCRMQINDSPDDKERKFFVLDIDCFTKIPQSIAITDTLAWVKQAHDTVIKMFEYAITDETRKLID